MQIRIIVLMLALIVLLVPSIEGATWCHQENISQASGCGDVATDPVPHRATGLWGSSTTYRTQYDGEDVTFYTFGQDESHLWINWTEATGTIQSVILSTYDFGSGSLEWRNHTLPSYCFNLANSVVSIETHSDNPANDLVYYCYNDTGQQHTLDSVSGGVNERIYEIELYWLLEDASSPVLDVQLVNSLYQDLEPIDDSEPYFVALNYTVGGDPATSSECNFTGYNITSYFPRSSASDEVLDDLGESLHIDISDDNENLTEDFFGFTVCQGNVASTLEVRINGTGIKNISTEVPLCTLGNHTEYTNITYANNWENFNFSVACIDCTASGQSAFTFRSIDSDTMSYEREYTTHTNSVSYVAEALRYVYTDHEYSFKESTGYIEGICNGTWSNETFTVGDRNLTIRISSLQNLAFTNGTVIPPNATTDLIVEIFNDQIVDINVSVTYFNGTIAQENNTEALTLTHSQLFVYGKYHINISATDDDGVTAYHSGHFIYNDTTDPLITWSYPLGDNTSSSTLDVNQYINITFTDFNLFAYEVLIFNPEGSLYYNYTATNIGADSFSFSEVADINESGNWTVQAFISDSHTDKLIDPIKQQIIDKELLFEVDVKEGLLSRKENVSITYSGLYDLLDTSTTKETDRYTWDYEFYYGDDKFNKEITHSFEVRCQDAYIVRNSRYTGHIVCYEAQQWVDFESDNVIDYQFYDCGVDCYEVALTVKPSIDEKIHFSSIGGINVYSESASIYVPGPSGTENYIIEFLKFRECPTDTTPRVLMFAFIFLILVILYLIAEFIIKLPIVSVLVYIGWIFFGLSLMGCHIFIGVLFIFISVGLILFEVLRGRGYPDSNTSMFK